MGTDFFDSTYGQCKTSRYRRPVQRVINLFHDWVLKQHSSYQRVVEEADSMPARHVLVLGVDVPDRSQDLVRVMEAIAKTRHRVTQLPVPLLKDKGKFENVNAALRNIELDGFDWMIILDDDVAVPQGFLDLFIYVAESANLQLCQPAHTLHSIHSYELTRRATGSLARVTHFVECGPVTAFHHSIFQYVTPFPELRWAWGTDIYWGEIARQHSFRLGVVDCTPVTHLRLLGQYDGATARSEAVHFMEEKQINRARTSILETVQVISKL